MPEATCAACGNELPTPEPGKRRRTAYCSRRCANREATRRHRAAGKRKPQPIPSVTKRCAWCDHEYTTTRLNGRYCSNSCAAYGNGRALLTSELRWRRCRHCDVWYCHGPCPTRDTHPVKPPPDMSPRPCRSCGVSFIPAHRCAHRAIYCSRRCNRREAANRHRVARRNGATSRDVNRWRIYLRDRWICQLCGKKVPRDVLVPHPLARTLDHILPVCLGGEHTEANLQLAHFECNSRKSANAWNHAEQLRLL